MTRFRQLALVLLVGACAGQPLHERPEPMGDFRLGYAIAVVDRPEQGPFSRVISDAQIKADVESAVGVRLGRYDGDGLYHIGMAVGGYVLAQPGVPLVFSPKSIMIVDVTVFDNATRQKLNAEPYRITAFEGLENTVPILGSGLARNAEKQLENLSAQVAVQLENWLRDNPQWFVAEPGQTRVPFDPATARPPAGAEQRIPDSRPSEAPVPEN
jgi:hypothetical protein